MQTLKQVIEEGEHERQSFKMRIDDQQQIAQTLVAFANTNGGRLLIGVKNNGKITGVFPEEELHALQSAADFFCHPPISFRSEIWEENMKLVLAVKIEPNPKRFVKAKDENGSLKYYVRILDKTVKANKILIKLWQLEQQNIAKPLVFQERELHCLKILANNEKPITLSQLYKQLSFPKKEVDASLALLVHWEMAKWIWEEGFYKYATTGC